MSRGLQRMGIIKWKELLGSTNVRIGHPLILNQIHPRQMSSYGKKIAFKPPHLDELPVPSGSWKVHYDTQNSKYTRHLLFGAAFWLFTVIAIKKSEIIFFNYSPPPLGDEEDEDCVPPPTKKC